MHNAQLKSSELQQQQLAFAAYIRDPQEHNGIDGVAGERMAVYRDLFFNNIKETLSSAFPVLHQVLPVEQWQTLCKQFFAEYRCHTPYLSRVPFEFVTYLQQTEVNDPPWMIELAQWELTELELFLAEDAVIESTHGDDILNAVPMLSPLASLHGFKYAVHQISVDYIPDTATDHTINLLAWRKPDDDIGFMQLNALSARLLELIRDNRARTTQDILSTVAAENSEFDPAVILQGGLDTLHSLLNNAIVYLTTPKG